LDLVRLVLSSFVVLRIAPSHTAFCINIAFAFFFSFAFFVLARGTLLPRRSLDVCSPDQSP